MLNAERETIATVDDEDRVVRIFTCRAKDIRAFDNKPFTTCVDRGKYVDGTEWAKYEIDEKNFSFPKAVKREVSDAERETKAQRMRELHKNRKTEYDDE